MNKVLAVGAHPDDIELGCQGTLEKHLRDGDEVVCAVYSKGREDLLDQKHDTVPLLDIIQWVEGQVEIYRPTIIYTHSGTDLNEDHKAIHKAVVTACRPLPDSIVREIYCFEILSSTTWGFGFNPTVFVALDESLVAEKIRVLEENYEDEMRQWPHPRSRLGVGVLACFRGMAIGTEYAEAFELVRLIK